MGLNQILANPQCFVEIYPHEGGAYAITGGQVLECTTHKEFYDAMGSFRISLAPGGPNGPNIGPSWIDVITPMSFVMIGMARGQYKQIVMLGVAMIISEEWQFSDRPVERVTIVEGADFGYFFTHFSWYALTFLNISASALGIALGNQNAGTLAGLGGGLTQGTPDSIGAAFYKNVMDGTQGILFKTWLEDGQNNPVLFSDAVAVMFEVFKAQVLFSFSYINAEENWWDKFNKIFQPPFYEFFIMTAPTGFYSQALSTSWNNVSSGMQFTMKGLGPNYAANINVIARVNPLPMVPATPDGSSATFGTVDTTAWNALKLYTEDTSLITTAEHFTEQDVRNFYLINPTYQRSMLGGSNSAVTPPLFQLSAAVDTASVHRYGFRPVFIETEWFSDPSGQIAVGGILNISDLIAFLTMRLATFYEPLPLMMNATRRGVLRPDIVPGCRFQYQPLKEGGNSPWQFYITSVEHNYKFGGPSTTTLGLARGLPANVYSDSNLLTQILLGNAERVDGVYQQGLPNGPGGSETALQPISLVNQDIQQILANIAPIYATPGMK